jgi:integrase
MLEELQRRNYSTDTIRGYILALEQFARHFRKSPERMGIQEIGQFQLHLLREKKLALGTIALRMGALRFLYKKTLKRRDLDFDDLPLLKKPKKLPVVPTESGGSHAPDRSGAQPAVPNLAGAALRHGLAPERRGPPEGERHRPLAHADPRPSGQGSRDRKLPLTHKVLDALCEYWRAAKIKPRVYLFPTRKDTRIAYCMF